VKPKRTVVQADVSEVELAKAKEVSAHKNVAISALIRGWINKAHRQMERSK